MHIICWLKLLNRVGYVHLAIPTQGIVYMIYNSILPTEKDYVEKLSVVEYGKEGCMCYNTLVPIGEYTLLPMLIVHF